jgi:hypothetical protein
METYNEYLTAQWNKLVLGTKDFLTGKWFIPTAIEADRATR